MLSNLQKSKLLLIILLATVSCTNKSSDSIERFTNTNFDKLLNRSLARNYYTQVQKDIGLSINANSIYLLTDANKGFIEKDFLLHFVKEDNTFLNKDFALNDFLQNDSLYTKFKKLAIINVPINVQNFSKIRIGQYNRLEDGSTKNIWVNEIKVRDIESKMSYYKNEFRHLIKKNIVNESFDSSLEFGAFFKNSNGFYLCYESDFIYIIAADSSDITKKFMLHFIDVENTFVNSSFFFKDREIQHLLEKPYSGFRVARMGVPQSAFEKIRIGQYNKNGNIWMQEFRPKDISANPLLKYNNEFQEYKP